MELLVILHVSKEKTVLEVAVILKMDALVVVRMYALIIYLQVYVLNYAEQFHSYIVQIERIVLYLEVAAPISLV
jgi:hypothetical protein